MKAMTLTYFLKRLDDFGGPQVLRIIGILVSFIEHMDLYTGASPFARREQKSQILLDGYGKNQFVSVHYFLLIRLVPQPKKTWEKLPSVVSQEGASHSWTQEFLSLELEAAVSGCSLVVLICSFTFLPFSLLYFILQHREHLLIPEPSLTFPAAESEFTQILNLG